MNRLQQFAVRAQCYLQYIAQGHYRTIALYSHTQRQTTRLLFKQEIIENPFLF